VTASRQSSTQHNTVTINSSSDMASVLQLRACPKITATTFASVAEKVIVADYEDNHDLFHLFFDRPLGFLSPSIIYGGSVASRPSR
jgi:hypothetical protein